MATSEFLPLATAAGIQALRQEFGKPGLMGHSIAQLEQRMAKYLGQASDIPGHGEAGSYEHNQHYLNYQLCETAGMLYQITGEQAYADWCADLLSRYADCYTKLGFQKAKNTNPPGRIFHQILNENVWLLGMSIGYGCVRASLSDAQRAHIDNQLFRPAVSMLTELYASHFGTIHNHGLWGVAAVGTCGIVIGDDEYVRIAVDGLAGDRQTGGYLAEISQLFSPSGYYIEGPYYHRFAIKPLVVFAEVLHIHRPELDIFNFNNQGIKATITGLLATTYPNGCLPALNDSSRSMGIHDEGLLIAASVYNAHYGDDPAIHALARQQGKVWVQPAALGLAASADALNSDAPPFWPSIELAEGPQGERGAQGFLRLKANDGDITQVCMAYGQHGMGHGHFDTLGITLFNRGEEVLRDYGFGRWVNVETKFGGRYLNENKTWARQTVAHNCVVVDRQTQNGFDLERADSVHGLPHFFVGSGDVQAMSAFANDHYTGVAMQRSVLLIQHAAFSTPILIDLFRLKSDSEHDYDYALQYSGQICETTASYEANTTQWSALGESDGYQHLMGMAQGKIDKGFRLTWLQGQRFNTWLSAAESGELIFAQMGGNDASFNLRREPTMILRQRAATHLFASAFETHGLFDETNELCYGARGQLSEVRVIGHDDTASVVELIGNNVHLLVMISNQPDVQADSANQVTFGEKTYRWQGYFACQTV